MMTRRERSVVTGKTPVYGRRKVSRGAGKVWKRTHNGCAFGLRQGETLNTLTIILPDTSKQRRANRVTSHIVMHARRACHNVQAQAEHIVFSPNPVSVRNRSALLVAMCVGRLWCRSSGLPVEGLHRVDSRRGS